MFSRKEYWTSRPHFLRLATYVMEQKWACCGLFLLFLQTAFCDKSSRRCGNGLNYTIPGANLCKAIRLNNGTLIQTIPKLMSGTLLDTSGGDHNPLMTLPRGIFCRLPDCYINPCLNGWCEETMRGYECHCFPPYKGKTCSDRAVPTTTHFTNASTTPPHRHSLNTEIASTMVSELSTDSESDRSSVTPSSSVSSSTGVSTIFITDQRGKKIYMGDLDSLELTVFLTLPSKPFSIIFDKSDQMVYWTMNNAIWKAGIFNRTTIFVFSVTGSDDLAIDESEKVIYCACRLANNIKKIKLGQSPQEIDFINGTYLPSALVIDESKRYLYWARRHAIERIHLNTSNRENFNHGDNWIITGLSVSPEGTGLFINRYWNRKGIYYKSVSASDLVDLTSLLQLNGTERPLDVTFFNGSLYYLTRGSSQGIGVLRAHQHHYDDASKFNRIAYKPTPGLEYPERFVIGHVHTSTHVYDHTETD